MNFFSTYDACCQFGWMDTEKCRANKPVSDSEKWYPIVEKGYCLNNGSPPGKVALSDTSQECCKKFFSSSKKSCIDKSNKRWYPDYNAAYCKNDGDEPQGILMSETPEMCCDRFMSSSKNACYSASKAYKFNAPPPTTSPSKRPTERPVVTKAEKTTPNPISSVTHDSCQLLPTQKKCKKDTSCEWDGESCSFKQTRAPVTRHPTVKPSKIPTAKPTHQPSHQSINEVSVCMSLKNKRQCAQYDTCRWDSTFDNCVSLAGPPQSECQSLHNKRKCSQNDLCGWSDTFNICVKVSVTEKTTTTTSTTTTTTESPTHKPTRKPRPEPTPKPSFRPSHKPTEAPLQTAVGCSSHIRKKLCTSDTACRWDDGAKKCLIASIAEETENPTYYPTAEPVDKLTQMWYPIIAQSRCVVLPSSSPEDDPYATYLECCQNPWINDRDACLEDAKTQLDPKPPEPSELNKFYPDYFRGSCQNDGKQPASETNLYETLDECCKNEWLDYSRCKRISSNEPLSNSGPNGNKYYPDYFFNICRNDGNQLPSETYLFDNIEDCCGLEYMDYEGCVFLSD